jgi:hypothetical protein
MSYIESTTRVIRAPGDPQSSSTILVKDTYTVEDILYLTARRAATAKVREVNDFTTPTSAIAQITRVPHVR